MFRLGLVVIATIVFFSSLFYLPSWLIGSQMATIGLVFFLVIISYLYSRRFRL